MKYWPIPVELLPLNAPLPVDLWTPSGMLLLRKGQSITSAAHRDKLAGHKACALHSEAQAWQRAYERLVHEQLRAGMPVQDIARLSMPSEIPERDYVQAEVLQGGWLDVQEVLRGLLYQGGLSMQPLQRLANIQRKLHELLKADPDDSLFCLFQALSDDSLGYCATHALLCAVVCELTAQKLALPAEQRQALMDAALTMNISMAQEQDTLSRQQSAPSPAQRELIQDHPEKSVQMLQAFGLLDTATLDLVRWHHDPDSAQALPELARARHLLSTADIFVARVAARKTRGPRPAIAAVKDMVLGAQGDALGLNSALAQAVGFYPPGSYCKLANRETAVVVQRGERANLPWVVSVLDATGVPLTPNVAKDTTIPQYSITAPVSFEKVHVALNADKIRKLRTKIPPHQAVAATPPAPTVAR